MWMNEIETYTQRIPRGRRMARWLAGMLAVWLTVGYVQWPAGRAMAGEAAVTKEAVSTAGARSNFIDLLQGEFDPDLQRFVRQHEPSEEFFQCVESIDRTVEEDGIRVTLPEAISDGRYMAVYMEVENLVPQDWAMVDVTMSAQVNGKAALLTYRSGEAMWVPYTLHPDDKTRTRPYPWFGVFELPLGDAGEVSVTAEVRIFRLNGPLVMVDPNLYAQEENADDPWPDLFRARMEAYGVIVAGEDELDATAWAQDGYIPITGSKFALDEGYQLLPDAAEARGEITHTGTVSMTFTVRGDAGAICHRTSCLLTAPGIYRNGSV